MATRTIRDVLADIPVPAGEATDPEVIARIQEGFPKIGRSMLALALRRVEARGLSELRPTEGPSFENTTFIATHYDTITPHTQEYQLRMRDDLEYFEERLAQEKLREIDLPDLHMLREYAAQPVEARRGGAVSAALEVKSLHENRWIDEGTIDMELEEVSVSGNGKLGLPSGDAEIRSLEVRSDRITDITTPVYLDVPRLGVLAEVVKIFEAAREEDIQVITPVSV